MIGHLGIKYNLLGNLIRRIEFWTKVQPGFSKKEEAK